MATSLIKLAPPLLLIAFVAALVVVGQNGPKQHEGENKDRKEKKRVEENGTHDDTRSREDVEKVQKLKDVQPASSKSRLKRQLSFQKEQLAVVTDAVGGHTSKQRGPAMLRGEGVILKPFQDAGGAVENDESEHSSSKRKRKQRGEMEAEFYARVWSTDHPLKVHQPEYYGIEVLADGTKYLLLEDLTHGMEKPCVLDLKMGRRSYDEHATPDKIAKEKAKYPPQEIVGFRFSGMRVYQPATKDWVKPERDWCFSIQPTQIADALERFFFDGRSVRRQLIGSVLTQVGAIAKCLEDFPTWRMYGASLLIIYDGASADDIVKVRLIDFAHCYEIKDEGGKDYGFLHGLYFLLSALNDLLDRGRMNLTRRGSLVDNATRLIVQSSERTMDDSGTEGSGTPQLAQIPSSVVSSTTSLGEVPPASADLAETLEILQHDPHLAPVVRKKLGTTAEDESIKRLKRRTRSLQDILDSSSHTSSPASAHQRSPSSNDVMYPSKMTSPLHLAFKQPKSAATQEIGSNTQGFSLDGDQLTSSSALLENEMDNMILETERVTSSDVVLPSPKVLVWSPSRATEKAQVGGAHDNIYLSDGTIEKEEIDKEHFEAEVRFYQAIAQDSLGKIVPAFIRVDESVHPRRLILEDVTCLVAQPVPAAMDSDESSAMSSKAKVNVMDIKLGFRSFRADVSNESKKSYFEKYLECINGLPEERLCEVWNRVVGRPDGPDSLKNRLLGKKDYLLFRDGTTTSYKYGFRLTALKHSDFEVSQEAAKTKVDSYNAFLSILEKFLSNGTNGFDSELAANFIQEIDSILEAIGTSEVFHRSEFVGSSLLFVHQGGVPAVRWIDFANISSPPSEDHNGIVYGIRKLRSMLDELIRKPQLDI